MKSNFNTQRQDRNPYEQSNFKRHDDFNILAPSPDFDLSFPDDEDELSDYNLMAYDLDEDIDFDIDYDE